MDWEPFVPFIVAVILVGYCLFGLDDLIVDLIAAVRGIGPVELGPEGLRAMESRSERSIAVMIASWKESGVLKRMISGNARGIRYSNYHFFLGVYPNDEGTLSEARELARSYPNVHVIVNPLPGPTSKGQMLNEVVRGIFSSERELGVEFDAFVMHDSEDVIHPLGLKLVNWLMDRHDFVQVPIFSLPAPLDQLVAGIYQDEFAEWHTKDILVRNHCGASVPSAGTGTALSRPLVLATLRQQRGDFLNPGSLTEDYELGVRSHRGFRSSRFACYFVRDEEGKREYIATRAYFPRRFSASVRQKTRWTVGIVFQGIRNLGWATSGRFAETLIENYFLYRDRKGALTNVFNLAGFAVLPLFFVAEREIEAFWPLMALNLVFMANRIGHRIFCTARVYGWSRAAPVPLRFPVANLVNACAAIRAFKQYLAHLVVQTELKWSKTDHELPPEFGLEVRRKAG